MKKQSLLLFTIFLTAVCHGQITVDPDRIGINVDTPQAALHIEDPGSETNVIIRNNNAVHLRLDAGSPNLNWYLNGTNKATISWSANQLKLYSSPPVPPFNLRNATLNLSENRYVGIRMGLIDEPTEALDVNGRVKVGFSADSASAGTVRYNPSTKDFEGFNGTEWVSLTRSNYSWGISKMYPNERYSESNSNVGDKLGWAVAVSGNYAVVGVPYADGGYTDAGEVQVLFYNGNHWEHQQTLFASDASHNNHFGWSVDISGDYLIVGAPGNNDKGAAYVFERSGTTWSPFPKIAPGDLVMNDEFGYCVAIDGTYAIIGQPLDDVNGNESGSAYIFERNGAVWDQHDKLTPSDGAGGDNFGGDVDIFDTYVVIGSAYNDDAGSASGSAYIFHRTSDDWDEQIKLTAFDAALQDFFGNAVTIHNDFVAIGANGDDDKGEESGSVYIYQRSGVNWNFYDKILASDGDALDNFGSRLSMYGDRLLVGVPTDDNPDFHSGSAYMFYHDSSSWLEDGKLSSTGLDSEDLFGYAVGLSEVHAIIGAHNDDDDAMDSGAVFFFSK